MVICNLFISLVSTGHQIPPPDRVPARTFFSAYYLPCPEPSDVGEYVLLTEDGKYLIRRELTAAGGSIPFLRITPVGEERYEDLYTFLVAEGGSSLPKLRVRDRLGFFKDAARNLPLLESAFPCILAPTKDQILIHLGAERNGRFYQGVGTILRNRRSAYVEGQFGSISGHPTVFGMYPYYSGSWLLVLGTGSATEAKLKTWVIAPGVRGSYKGVKANNLPDRLPDIYKLVPSGPTYGRTRIDPASGLMAYGREGASVLAYYFLKSKKTGIIQSLARHTYGSGFFIYKGRLFANMIPNGGDASNTRLYEYSWPKHHWTDRGPYVLVARSRSWRYAMFLDARNNKHFVSRMP